MRSHAIVSCTLAGVGSSYNESEPVMRDSLLTPFHAKYDTGFSRHPRQNSYWLYFGERHSVYVWVQMDGSLSDEHESASMCHCFCNTKINCFCNKKTPIHALNESNPQQSLQHYRNILACNSNRIILKHYAWVGIVHVIIKQHW
jgi:hypothetical protein